MSLEPLYAPVERVDHLLGGALHAAPLPVALTLAALLGLRHALDPDHLVAVSSLVAARGRGVRAGTRIGACWGAGHAMVLVALGLPLIALHGELPSWLPATAEKAIGVLIAVLAGRLLLTWARSGMRLSTHTHPPAPSHRHAHHVHDRHDHGHRGRTPLQALTIGAVHGLAGTGAVVLLLVTALPDPAEATVALVLFAVMSVVSMAACTGAFAWVITWPALEDAVDRVFVPALGVFGLLFGIAFAAAP